MITMALAKGRIYQETLPSSPRLGFTRLRIPKRAASS